MFPNPEIEVDRLPDHMRTGLSRKNGGYTINKGQTGNSNHQADLASERRQSHSYTSHRVDTYPPEAG